MQRQNSLSSSQTTLTSSIYDVFDDCTCSQDDYEQQLTSLVQTKLAHRSKGVRRKLFTKFMDYYHFQGLPDCCKKHHCTSRYTHQEILKHQILLNSKNEEFKRMQIRKSIVKSTEDTVSKFLFKSDIVCIQAFKILHGCSNNMIFGGKVHSPKIRESAKCSEVLMWLDELSSYCDVMPDSADIHLPHASKKEVYWQFLVDHNEEQSKLPEQERKHGLSYNYFLKCWKNNRFNIKLRKQMRFAKCDTCVTNRETIRHSMSVTEKQQARDVLKAHYALVKKERHTYYAKRALAIKHPELYLSMIIDGSDMANYGLPYFHVNTKAQTGWKMRFGLMGVIVHGIAARAYMYHKHWSNDSNLTIEVIHRTLSTLQTLPPTLYLQLDNAASSNKNRYVFGYLAFLVQKRVFETIELTFLPVGHTHEDIDQMFSRFAVWLRLRDSFKKYPMTVVELTAVAKFKETLKESSCMRPLTGNCNLQQCRSQCAAVV